MARTTSKIRIGLVLVAGLGVSLPEVRGQAAGPGAASPVAGAAVDLTGALRIRKFPRLSNERDWRQRTPVFAGQASRNPREWGVFEVVFDSAPKWIDELVVTFHVMSQGLDEAGGQQFNLYRLTSRFVDIAQDRNRVVSAVLLPTALMRHGKPIGFAVEFAIGGKVVATESDVAAPFLKDRWWENPMIVDSPKTIKREGYLLERSKTPFGLVNIDDNEVSK